MNLKDFLQENEKKIINDLSELISIKTYDGSGKKTDVNPLGNNIDKAFKLIEKICTREGLYITNYDNYAVAVDTNKNPTKIDFAFLNHIDTVNVYEFEKWLTPPFELTYKNNHVYGRGVNDNKGPLIYVLYLLIYLKREQNYKKNIRMIIGGAEETTWEGIKYYKAKNLTLNPLYALSPDGNFPVINLEKGIIYFEYEENIEDEIIEKIISIDEVSNNCHHLEIITKEGIKRIINGSKCKSRSPEKGKSVLEILNQKNEFAKSNVINFMLTNFQTKNGHLFALDDYVNEEKNSSFNVSSINYMDGRLIVKFDYRYIYDYDETYIMYKLKKRLKNGKIKIQKKHDFHFLPESTLLNEKLKESYQKITKNELTFHTKGAASYARSFSTAICAGPLFDDETSNSHQPNEVMRINNMIKACEIYEQLIYSLFGG